jgi:Tfp pilus assembly protein PilF
VALAAGNFEEARSQVAAARAHEPTLARAALLAARIASAAREPGKALDLYVAALRHSRTIRSAFEAEARAGVAIPGGRAR